MSDQETKTEKPASCSEASSKAPGVFRKPIKKEKFENSFLKHIEQPQDKQFLTGCFELREGEYVIREPLTKSEIKKLKELYKWIKKNRKIGIKLVPLIFAGIVIAGLVIFFSIFANPLLGRATELGLEAIFEAKADVRNFRLSLLKFEISVVGITVANRDKPMTNLFEMDRTIVKLKPEAVLRGKIYIEEISADNIRFGTERTVSGAIPLKPAKEKAEKEKSEAPPLIDLKNFDAMALLNQEYDKLSSPKLYDEAINAYNETVTKWQGQVDAAKTKVNELQTASRPLLNLNVSSFSVTDTAAITKTVQDITTMVSAVQGATDTATGMISGIEADINKARNLEQNARNAITGDINLLKSYIDISGGAAFEALEPFIRDMLSDTAEQYLDYGLIALEALEKLKAEADAKPKSEKEEKPKKEKKEIFKGRDVPFPVKSYPAFYLGRLASSITFDTWGGDFDLNDISSNPDLTGKPVTMHLGITETGGGINRYAGFEGKADFRDQPVNNERYTANVKGGGFPVNLGDALSKAGINGLSGNSDFTANLTGKTDGAFSVNGNVKITNARIINPEGTLAEACDTAIRDVGLIDLGVQYTHKADEKDEFNLTTNLKDLIASAMRRIAEAYAKQAMDEIEKALRKKIDDYLGDKFDSKDQVDLLLRTARGDKAALDQVKNSLNSKKTEFENRAKQAGSQAVQDALKGNTPTIPSTGGVKLPW